MSLRVLLLIAKQADDQSATSDEALAAAAALRDTLGDDFTFVGPTVNVPIENFPAHLTNHASETAAERADVVILEAHGAVHDDDKFYRMSPRTGHADWNPRAMPAPVSYPVVIIGSCWAGLHLGDFTRAFASGTRIVACTGIARVADVEHVYKPVLKLLATGHTLNERTFYEVVNDARRREKWVTTILPS